MEIEEITFEDYDKRGVRPYVVHSIGTGKYKPECYRKKTKEESKGDSDWQMIKVSYPKSYETRREAEKEALNMAQEICDEFGF